MIESLGENNLKDKKNVKRLETNASQLHFLLHGRQRAMLFIMIWALEQPFLIRHDPHFINVLHSLLVRWFFSISSSHF